MNTTVRIIASGLLVGALGCADASNERAPSEAEVAAARADIAQAIRSWAEVWKSGDATAAAAGFTVDAINMRPGAANDNGRTAVEGMARDFLSTVTINEVTFTTQELDIYGDIAYELGTFVQRYTDGGAEVTQRSRYMAVWRREDDGTWKYHRFLFNNLPSS